MVNHERKMNEDEKVILTLATNVQQNHSVIQNLDSQLSSSWLTIEEEKEKNKKLLEELDSYSILLNEMTEKQRKLESEIAYLITVKTTLEEEKENLIISYNTSSSIAQDEIKRNNEIMLTKSRSEIAMMEERLTEIEEEKRGEQVKAFELKRCGGDGCVNMKTERKKGIGKIKLVRIQKVVCMKRKIEGIKMC
jgi:chromosome segregation ATPase